MCSVTGVPSYHSSAKYTYLYFETSRVVGPHDERRTVSLADSPRCCLDRFLFAFSEHMHLGFRTDRARLPRASSVP